MYYTNLKDAKEIITERKSLKNKIPTPLDFEYPIVVVSKPAMFRVESALAIHMAEQIGMDICWLTYNSEKYVDSSKIKRSVVQPYFTEKFDRRGEFISEKISFVKQTQTINKIEFEKIQTSDKLSVIDLHRQRLLSALPSVKIFDLSTWVKSLGGNALSYYESYLSLFVAHAVLFEDYHGGESGEKLSAFTENIFKPAFEKVTQKFGAKPVVVKLPWKPYYAYHPKGEMLTRWRDLVIPKL